MSSTHMPYGLSPAPLYSAAPALNSAAPTLNPAAPTGTGAAPSPRLVSSAHEFEAQMMKELLAPLSSTGMGEGDEDQGSGSALTAYASEALGRALSNGGGFGIADRILHSVSHSGTQTSKTQGIESLSKSFQIRNSK